MSEPVVLRRRNNREKESYYDGVKAGLKWYHKSKNIYMSKETSEQLLKSLLQQADNHLELSLKDDTANADDQHERILS